MKTIHISQRTSVKYKMSYRWWGRATQQCVKQSKEWLIWGPQPVLHSTLSPLTSSVKIPRLSALTFSAAGLSMSGAETPVRTPAPGSRGSMEGGSNLQNKSPHLGLAAGSPQPKHDPRKQTLGRILKWWGEHFQFKCLEVYGVYSEVWGNSW